MRSVVFFLITLTMPGVIIADASNGQFMGYQLGDSYQRTEQTQDRVTTTGNLAIEAEHPIKPANIGDVTLIVTPETLTIGRISALTWFDTEAEAREFGRAYSKLLRAKYPDWAFGREEMNADMRVIEVNLDKSPHNLQLRLTKWHQDGEPKWGVTMRLGWLPDTQEETAWQSISHAEQEAASQKDRELLLDQADMRGL